MQRLQPLINEYQNIEIPEEVEVMVRKTISDFESRRSRDRKFINFAAAAAAAAILFVGAVNLSPVTASAMSKIPVLKELVRIVTIKELTYQSDNREVSIKVPQIEGLPDSQLEKSLNEKYLEQNTALYEEFLARTGQAELSPMNLALFTDYKIKTHTEDILVVEQIKTEIAASGAESVRYDNIDLNKQIIITLPSLFIDDSYIDVISDNIRAQMLAKTNKAEGIIFFIEGDGTVGGGFDKIAPDQTFYITADSQLVIVFDEYAVAPGSMGIVEFTIPTEVIRGSLVSNTYIK